MNSLQKSALLLLILQLVAGCAAPPQTPLAPTVARAADKGELDIRPPVRLNAAERARLAQLVNDDAQARALWQQVRAEAQQALKATPRPLQSIVYEGRLNTDPERIESVQHLRDMDVLSLLGYAFGASTGDEQRAYAAKMREFVLAWTGAYRATGNPINENKLEPVWMAYASLQETDTFSDEEKARVEAWLRALGEAHLRFAADNPWSAQNNWGTKRLKLMAQIGPILREPKFSDYAAREVTAYVENSLRPDGTSRDLEERDAMSYHVSSLLSILILARELEPGGQNLYLYKSPSGASLRRSVEFVAPYARGEKQYPQWRNTKVELDRQRAAEGLPEYQPGVLWKPEKSLKMFELASYFEPQFLPIVARLSGADDANNRFPTWNIVLLHALKTEPTSAPVRTLDLLQKCQ